MVRLSLWFSLSLFFSFLPITFAHRQINWVQSRLSQSEVVAGQWSRVRCSAVDLNERPFASDSFSLRVTPSDGIEVYGFQIRSKKAGTWEVQCVAHYGKKRVIDRSPASLRVRATKIHSFSVHLKPKNLFYRVGERVNLSTLLRDRFGNDVVHEYLQIRVEPSEFARVSGRTVLFLKEGRGHLLLKPFGLKQQRIISVNVDSEGPRIKILQPSRFLMFQGGEFLLIRGQVWDLSGVSKLLINGKKVAFNSGGFFSTKIRYRWGLNIVKIESWDNFGHKNEIHRSFLFSKKYQKNPQGKKIHFMNRAVVLRLSQSFLDDQKRSSLNDLASILEHALNHFDFDKQIPIALASGSVRVPPFGPTIQYVVKKRGKVKIGKVKLRLRFLFSAIELKGSIQKVHIPLAVHIGRGIQRPIVKASSIHFRIKIALLSTRTKMKFRLERSEFNFSKIEMKGLSGIYWLVSPILERVLRSRAQSELSSLLKTKLLPLLGKVLTSGGIKEAFRLPEELGGQTIGLRSKLQAIQIDKKGISVVVNGGVQMNAKGRSLLKREGFGPIQSRFVSQNWPDEPLSLTFSVDLLNRLFFSAWQSGFLTRDLTPLLQQLVVLPELPVSVQFPKLKIQMGLPPVFMPGTKKYPLILGIGAFRVTLILPRKSKPDARIEMVTSMHLGFRVEAKKQKIRFVLASKPLGLEVQILKIVGLSRLQKGQLSEFLQTFSERLMPKLAQVLVQDLPISIPKLPKLLEKQIPGISRKTLALTRFSFDGRHLLFSVAIK